MAAIDGRVTAVLAFTLADGPIIEVDILTDPQRLAALDLSGQAHHRDRRSQNWLGKRSVRMDHTLMTITHSALTADLVDQHLRGWQLIAGQLDAVLQSRERAQA